MKAKPPAIEEPPEAALSEIEEPPAVEKPLEAAPTIGELQGLHKKCFETKDLDLFELCLPTLRGEELGEEQQAFYRKAEATGLGACSRCRWKYGCS